MLTHSYLNYHQKPKHIFNLESNPDFLEFALHFTLRFSFMN